MELKRVYKRTILYVQDNKIHHEYIYEDVLVDKLYKRLLNNGFFTGFLFALICCMVFSVILMCMIQKDNSGILMILLWLFGGLCTIFYLLLASIYREEKNKYK